MPQLLFLAIVSRSSMLAPVINGSFSEYHKKRFFVVSPRAKVSVPVLAT
jgi:hypothetical protein